MKINIILILTFVLYCCCSGAMGFFELDQHKPDSISEKDIHKHRHCMNKKGYESKFTVTSFNGVFPTGNHNFSSLSFQEFGFLSVDFHKRRMRVDYYFRTIEGAFNGSLWAFNDTQSMYIVQNGTCNKLPLGFEVPSGFPKHGVHYWGRAHLGKFPVVIFQIDPKLALNMVNQTVVYDPEGCAPVTTISKNLDPNNVGYSTMEFFEFKNKLHKSHFKLPSECVDLHDQDIKVSHNHKEKHEQKTRLPSILKIAEYL